MIKNAIFDLDGTLTDPREGIVNGLRLTFGEYGITVENPEEYDLFIGPALRAFMPERFPGLGDEVYDAVLRSYRAYYNEKGKYENTPYPDVDKMLGRLRAAGFRLAVATSKPKVFADEILEHFGLSVYFEYVAGPPLYHAVSDKSYLVSQCMEALEANADETIMVGDRKYDIHGAHSVGIKCIAVLYGFGRPDELGDADYLVSSTADLTQLLLNMNE